MKITRLYFLLLSCVVIFLTTTAYLVKETGVNKSSTASFAGRFYDNSKLIKFDHKLHVKDAGVKCEDCHIAAGNSVSSKDNLNPKQETCAGCHDVKDDKKCDFCHIDKNYKKLKHTSNELNFSHKFHTKDQSRACLDCHTGMDNVKYAKESAGAYPSMETCYTCHNNEKATNNCDGCHTNLTKLTPVGHKSPNFLNEHKIATDFANDKNPNKCMMCHTDNFCQACHSPVNYNGADSKTDFFAPYYTKENGTRTDRAALQKLTNMHNLNYRFTHGLDAMQKSFECKTCHDVQEFCAPCHQNGGETITGIAPTSHRQPNWTTIGVGTGGGLHSELARKDIEACQSCHDVEGSDPACIKCHFDNDGVKGTNPKTHETGFMHNEKGVWHNTQGAVCYTCHTDPNARPNGIKGVGFCGYCHAK